MYFLIEECLHFPGLSSQTFPCGSYNKLSLSLSLIGPMRLISCHKGILSADNRDPAVGQQFSLSLAKQAESRPKEELDAKPSLDFLGSKLYLSL